MSGPPKDIEPSQLWLKLSSTERPFKLVDFPRLNAEGEAVGQMAVRVLTQEEQMISTVAAEDFCRKYLKDAKKDELGYSRLFSDAYCVEVLYRACRDADDPQRPSFPSPKSIREQLSIDECGKLFEHYLTVSLEFGPLVSQMSDDEMEAWIDKLAEGGSAFLFDTLSSDLQRVVLMHMAYQLRPSRTDNSSVGELPEESSSDINSELAGEPAEE